MRRALTLLVLTLAVPTLAWATGLTDYLRDVERLRADVAALGVAAPLVWILCQSVAEGTGIPSTLPVLAAMVLWEPHTAFVVSVLASIGGTVVGFWLARSLARDWVLRRMPEWMVAYERYFTAHAFGAALGIRALLFLAPGPAAVMGLSRARFLPCLLGAALGCIPGLALLVFVGPEAIRLGGALPSGFWVALAVPIALGAAYAWWARREARLRLRRTSS